MAHIFCPLCGALAAPLRDKRNRGSKVMQYRCLACSKQTKGPRIGVEAQHRERPAYRKEKEARERERQGKREGGRGEFAGAAEWLAGEDS